MRKSSHKRLKNKKDPSPNLHVHINHQSFNQFNCNILREDALYQDSLSDCCIFRCLFPIVDSLPEMTLKQLAEFTGKNNSKVYLACKGIVFDVSASGNLKISNIAASIFQKSNSPPAIRKRNTKYSFLFHPRLIECN